MIDVISSVRDLQFFAALAGGFLQHASERVRVQAGQRRGKMSARREDQVRRLTGSHIVRRKDSEPLVALTACIAPIVEALDEPRDPPLLGDSARTVAHDSLSAVPAAVEVATLSTIESEDRVRPGVLTAAGDRAFVSGAGIGDLAGNIAASNVPAGTI